MTEIGCSLPTDIIYFKLPAEKGNIKKIGVVEFEIMVLAIYFNRAPSLLRNMAVAVTPGPVLSA